MPGMVLCARNTMINEAHDLVGKTHIKTSRWCVHFGIEMCIEYNCGGTWLVTLVEHMTLDLRGHEFKPHIELYRAYFILLFY